MKLLAVSSFSSTILTTVFSNPPLILHTKDMCAENINAMIYPLLTEPDQHQNVTYLKKRIRPDLSASQFIYIHYWKREEIRRMYSRGSILVLVDMLVVVGQFKISTCQYYHSMYFLQDWK
jgi:hypothetical protein